MNIYEILMICLTTISGIGIPILILFNTLALKSRDQIISRLQHLDDCFDTLQKDVLANRITREDLERFRADSAQTMTRMREAISQETHGLHQRIMRLEEIYLGTGMSLRGKMIED